MPYHPLLPVLKESDPSCDSRGIFNIFTPFSPCFRFSLPIYAHFPYVSCHSCFYAFVNRGECDCVPGLPREYHVGNIARHRHPTRQERLETRLYRHSLFFHDSSLQMSLSRPSMAAFDDGVNESFFEREKERLIQEISSVCNECQHCSRP